MKKKEGDDDDDDDKGGEEDNDDEEEKKWYENRNIRIKLDVHMHKKNSRFLDTSK